MWNLLVFAVIGLITGAAARLLYPDRRFMHTVGTMVIGAIGSATGGVISQHWWPTAENEFRTGNLIFSVLGAVALIGVWAGVAYQRRLLGYKDTPH